ncbi:6-pyruvoyl trahydropterin synthase family protein [Nonomuraea basaltis]|uniref:6-pyruvoyl trahydropterin synthase family protein n=1 Tax=Nonomuraea basaltis TaxID=2495887 RepID=UPI00110C70B7|nr:6-carboxytetrahydropterin synthase [Nonomuraea basaltis]TMR97553.1 6-carboxytetrahydropterin synthase [Nonomuraea basaltis]
MTHEIRVRHTFEAAHRLPHLPGKCVSLHGHSWSVEVTVAAPALDDAGMVVEFGAFKKALRSWLDHMLDHGSILGDADPLGPALAHFGNKVYAIVGGWPTVERVAEEISAVAEVLLDDVPHAEGARVIRVDLAETATNGASWAA